jgi:hypothetical protein
MADKHRGPHDLAEDGCGMGRAVMLAAEQPWGVVVEPDARLAAIARKGVAELPRRSLQQAKRVEVTAANATAYVLPAEISLILLFNSFSGTVLRDTPAQIKASWKRCPRLLRIADVQPVIDSDPLQAEPWLTLEAELPAGYFPNLWSRVYRATSLTAP